MKNSQLLSVPARGCDQPGKVRRIGTVGQAFRFMNLVGDGGCGQRLRSLGRQVLIYNLILLISWGTMVGLLAVMAGDLTWVTSAGCVAAILVLFRICKWASRELLQYHKMQQRTTEIAIALANAQHSQVAITLLQGLGKVAD